MKNTLKKLSIITLISLLAASCAPNANQIKHAREDAARRKQMEAEADARNLQRFPNLPTCKGFVSPNWTKVAYDENQGYCILRPLPTKKK